MNQARADSNRIFELRVYHDLPGKLPVMEARFPEETSKIPASARHNLSVVGYWVTMDASASESSFLFMLAHKEAKKKS